MSWNLRGATDAKWDHLLSLRPSVAVLPEAARDPVRARSSLLEPSTDWHWVGSNDRKGLAVATFDRPSGALASGASGRWAVGARSGRLTVVGIWSAPAQTGAYAREVERGLDAHARWLDPEADVVVAGDFNVAGGGSAAFDRLRAKLASFGLFSAYHELRGEPFGAETWPTYYHHRNRARPFHIDYCFLSTPLLARATAVEIGGYDDWVASGRSDHVPVVVEFDERPPVTTRGGQTS